MGEKSIVSLNDGNVIATFRWRFLEQYLFYLFTNKMFWLPWNISSNSFWPVKITFGRTRHLAWQEDTTFGLIIL